MNPLRDIVPAKYRKAVYALISLAAVAWTVYQASDGDWTQFVGGIVVALTTMTAASNTPPSNDEGGEGGSVDLVVIYYVLGIVFFTVATLWLLGVGTRGLF